MRLLIVFALALLSGCDSQYSVDQCVRVQLYERCMSTAPDATTVATWAATSNHCNSLSYGQAMRKPLQIPDKCK